MLVFKGKSLIFKWAMDSKNQITFNYRSPKVKPLEKEDLAQRWMNWWDLKKINKNLGSKIKVLKDKWQMAIIRNSFTIQLKTKFNIYTLNKVMNFLGILRLLRKRLHLAKILNMHFYMKLIIILGQSHLIDHFLMESIIGKLLLMLEQNMN